MALETSIALDELKDFDYSYEEDKVESLENEETPVASLMSGIGDFIGNNSSLLFFFLILVIIFNGSGTFSESNETLLFFFLILVILFNQLY